jgi:outer membrane protein assembly factor BamE (lipoprotein component of BamABCDE complex)
MKSAVVKILLGAGVAAALGACASIPDSNAQRADRFAQVRAGLTQDEVREIAGKPLRIETNRRTNETLWTYDYTDVWGQQAEFGVDFDNATGTVTETSTIPIDED